VKVSVWVGLLSQSSSIWKSTSISLGDDLEDKGVIGDSGEEW